MEFSLFRKHLQYLHVISLLTNKSSQRKQKWANQTWESKARTYPDSSCRNFFASLLWQVFTRGWEGFPKILGKITNNCETNRCFLGHHFAVHTQMLLVFDVIKRLSTALCVHQRRYVRVLWKKNRAHPDSTVLQNGLNEVRKFDLWYAVSWTCSSKIEVKSDVFVESKT